MTTTKKPAKMAYPNDRASVENPNADDADALVALAKKLAAQNRLLRDRLDDVVEESARTKRAAIYVAAEACPTCNGTGLVEESDPESGPSAGDIRDCQTCAGCGRVVKHSECGGHGCEECDYSSFAPDPQTYSELVGNRFDSVVEENEKLTEALKCLLGYATEETPDSPDCSGWTAAIEKARTALAQAKGARS